METFCAAVKSGEEPRKEFQGAFYVGFDQTLTGDPPRTDGLPELPGKWAGYLRDRVQIGTIDEVLWNNRLRINLGTRQGIHAGDLLAVQGRGRRFSPLKFHVIEVNETACVAAQIDPGIDLGTYLKPGWKVVAARKID